MSVFFTHESFPKISFHHWQPPGLNIISFSCPLSLSSAEPTPHSWIPPPLPPPRSSPCAAPLISSHYLRSKPALTCKFAHFLLFPHLCFTHLPFQHPPSAFCASPAQLASPPALGEPQCPDQPVATNCHQLLPSFVVS